MENIRVESKAHDSVSERHYTYYFVKRSADIIVSLAALIVLSPLMLIISLLIYKQDKHNPIYIQERIGLHGKPFKMFKFRSMIFNADKVLMANPMLYQEYLKNDFKLPEGKDPRVTKVGAFIRKTSLDEIPQFVNVLLGQMSLVGPRPIVQKELHEYGKDLDEFLSVKPGALGLWQASGRSNIGYPERCDIELEYVRNASIWFDTKVFFKCCISILKKDGAF
ncbi:sugar transferase [Lactobacillus jensenii]|jgi:PTS family maltose/glucose porter, IIABC component|uniref:sugar transferase n=1 Tax=Lactobacillus jensenii TaxID=109790 RepID=UPI0006F0DFFE|nr:sugar transferase [Lactobacillus jensenii]KRM49347.1 PTS family maltose glucose porter, IIABC component [Lactobacillus jensenii DSM 20557]MBQ4669099.1 sugar transferase [Lactobacillus jensenii]MBW8448596.1 sugar transferase [Lactobacillus jensenii]